MCIFFSMWNGAELRPLKKGRKGPDIPAKRAWKPSVLYRFCINNQVDVVFFSATEINMTKMSRDM